MKLYRLSLVCDYMLLHHVFNVQLGKYHIHPVMNSFLFSFMVSCSLFYDN